MPPPIRYPLPTLLALILVSLLVWQGAKLSRNWRAEMSARLKLGLEGPPVPSSPRPQVVAGPMTRRGLLLHDDTPAATRPNRATVETIDRRMFVDVYDTWPSPGPVSHVRVGNRKPIGWISADDVLLWDTRLVVLAPKGRLTLADSPDGQGQVIEVGPGSLPVLAWTDRAVKVAVWVQSKYWSKVARSGWVQTSELPAGSWGIWISQVELPILLGLTNQGDAPLLTRLRAVLGRLTDNRPWASADLDALRAALPPVVFSDEPTLQQAAERLAEANAQPFSEAGWAGFSFRFLPLFDLP